MIHIQRILQQDLSLQNLSKIALGVMFLFACSQIYIPLQPVPITMQTVGVMAIGVTCSMRIAISTIISYLLIGALGMPVFSLYGAGFARIIGPAGGYLVGFVPAVYLMTKLQNKLNMHKMRDIFINCMIGTTIIFTFGISWLAYLTSFKAAILNGFLPFVVPGIFKALALTVILKGVSSKKD